IEVERPRGETKSKDAGGVRREKGRRNYQEKLQRVIDEYNAGSMNVDVLFERLVQFVRQELNVEDQRHIAEQLRDEELAIFDLLLQPEVAPSEEDKAAVTGVVQELVQA